MKEVIPYIVMDTREIEVSTNSTDKFIFIALQGAQSHGLDHFERLPLVAQQKVQRIISDREYPNLKYDLPSILKSHYGNVQKEVKCIAFTGTNGKTTSTFYLASALSKLGYSVAVIGTIGSGIWPNLQTSRLTTPDICALHRLVYEYAHKIGVDYILLEASAQGIVQNRLENLKFECVVWTNFSQDHLDDFGDMDNYFISKCQIFDKNDIKYVTINISDPYGDKLYQKLKASKSHKKIDVVGSFYDESAENLIAVQKVLLYLGYSQIQADQAIFPLPQVPGRMERHEVQGRHVIIDFAHTPKALKLLLLRIQKHCMTPHEIWLVFGCGGDRDPSKRSEMACIADQYADQIIVTEDNSRMESLDVIIQMIVAGFTQKKPYVIPDRARAIQYALKMAKIGDFIILAGKGHERTLKKGARVIEFDERSLLH